MYILQALLRGVERQSLPLLSTREMVERPMSLSRPNLVLPALGSNDRSPQQSFLHTGKLRFAGDPTEYPFSADDLVDLGEIGRGNYGTVNKKVHRLTGREMAVKIIRSNNVEVREQERLIRELNTVMKSQECDYIIRFYGAIFYEGCCWICMELMDISLDKLYKGAFTRNILMTEEFVGHIGVCTIFALNHLKEHLKIIHRDVKPSNIVLNRAGDVKLVDFGISGELVDSIADTQDVGCRPYMAPERVSEMKTRYDVRSDVWSLGITLMEIATGKFPYKEWASPFEQLSQASSFS